jgi:hypothetical protein
MKLRTLGLQIVERLVPNDHLALPLPLPLPVTSAPQAQIDRASSRCPRLRVLDEARRVAGARRDRRAHLDYPRQ